jgi:hypothetical protein
MRISLFVILAVITLGLSVAAQTSLSLWPYYIEVTPEKSAPGMYDVCRLIKWYTKGHKKHKA